jgi:hypothetical protein
VGAYSQKTALKSSPYPPPPPKSIYRQASRADLAKDPVGSFFIAIYPQTPPKAPLLYPNSSIFVYICHFLPFSYDIFLGFYVVE